MTPPRITAAAAIQRRATTHSSCARSRPAPPDRTFSPTAELVISGHCHVKRAGRKGVAGKSRRYRAAPPRASLRRLGQRLIGWNGLDAAGGDVFVVAQAPVEEIFDCLFKIGG